MFEQLCFRSFSLAEVVEADAIALELTPYSSTAGRLLEKSLADAVIKVNAGERIAVFPSVSFFYVCVDFLFFIYI